jgi:hypothetical protein
MDLTADTFSMDYYDISASTWTNIVPSGTAMGQAMNDLSALRWQLEDGLSAGVGGKNFFVDFTNPVNNLTFQELGDDNAGVQVKVDVFVNGAFSATVPIAVDRVFTTPLTVDLSDFPNVTRIAVHDVTDRGGLAWDTFSFTPVPGPSALALDAIGALSTMAVIRRRAR